MHQRFSFTHETTKTEELLQKKPQIFFCFPSCFHSKLKNRQNWNYNLRISCFIISDMFDASFRFHRFCICVSLFELFKTLFFYLIQFCTTFLFLLTTNLFKDLLRFFLVFSKDLNIWMFILQIIHSKLVFRDPPVPQHWYYH